ncbi:MAG TPA: hypothetical protein VH500_04360 [Nitrososphaeraceae archaeon]|jgi:hypothetical protein
MFTKKINLATLLVITIVLARFAASLAPTSVNVKALGNDTFTRQPPT